MSSVNNIKKWVYFSVVFMAMALWVIACTDVRSNVIKAPMGDGMGTDSLREYWITAQYVGWDYLNNNTSSTKNLLNNKDMTGFPNTKFQKIRYFRYYKDFSGLMVEDKTMGILGPQIHAVEGDTIKVHFKNMTDKPLSMHPHGVHYTPANSGADFHKQGAVPPVGKCQSYTYEWHADEDAAPGPSEPSSKVWLYHSHVNSDAEIYDGLVGTIVVTKKGFERSPDDPRPKDVDKEFTTLFMIFDENRTVAMPATTVGIPVDACAGGVTPVPVPMPPMSMPANATTVGIIAAATDMPMPMDKTKVFHAMNGYIFGNLAGYTVHAGDKVRWYVVALGSEMDLHTAHWHGQTVTYRGERTDVIELLPASMKTVDMKATNLGEWLYHCHVTDHYAAGMGTRWNVIN